MDGTIPTDNPVVKSIKVISIRSATEIPTAWYLRGMDRTFLCPALNYTAPKTGLQKMMRSTSCCRGRTMAGLIFPVTRIIKISIPQLVISIQLFISTCTGQWTGMFNTTCGGKNHERIRYNTSQFSTTDAYFFINHQEPFPVTGSVIQQWHHPA